MNRVALKRLLLERKPWSHKGDFGRLLVIGGSEHYTGAPALAAMAALRSGCDVVTLAAPQRCADAAAAWSPNLIAHPLPGGYITKLHVPEIKKLIEGKDAVVIGNGIGSNRNTLEAVGQILNAVNVPCVIDGDAMQKMSGSLKGFILTPHEGDFKRMTGRHPGGTPLERKRSVEQFAQQIGATILLKGHVDVISDGKRTVFNKTGNAFMTKGGTGDALAGIAGALLARKVGAFDAAAYAAYISGRAGDIAAREKRYGLLATDVIDCIHKVV